MTTCVDGASKADDVDGEEAESKILEEIDEKRCHICRGVMINTCRISCGHFFCRRCIDHQLDPADNTERSELCVICDAKINEIQNCPEFDTEINTLYSKLSTSQRLERERIKSERRKIVEEDERLRSERKSGDASSGEGSQGPESAEHWEGPRPYCSPSESDNQSSSSLSDSAETFQYDQNPHEAFTTPASQPFFAYVDQQMRPETPEDSEASSEDQDGSFLVHETITFHRTMRVEYPHQGNSGFVQSNDVVETVDEYYETQTSQQSPEEQQFHSYQAQPEAQQEYYYDQCSTNFDTSHRYTPRCQYSGRDQSQYEQYNHYHQPYPMNYDPQTYHYQSYNPYQQGHHNTSGMTDYGSGPYVYGDPHIMRGPGDHDQNVRRNPTLVNNSYYSPVSESNYWQNEIGPVSCEEREDQGEDNEDEPGPGFYVNLNFDLLNIDSNDDLVEVEVSQTESESVYSQDNFNTDENQQEYYHHLGEECYCSCTDSSDDQTHYAEDEDIQPTNYFCNHDHNNNGNVIFDLVGSQNYGDDSDSDHDH